MPWLYGHLTYLISCLALMGSLVREIFEHKQGECRNQTALSCQD